MSLSKMTLLAAGLALGLSSFGVSTVAKAQGAQNTPGNMLTDVGEDDAVYVNPKTGKMTKAKIKVSAAHHTKAMAKGGRELAGGAMVYRKGGKLYLLENKPTTAGKTMMQDDFQDMFDGNHQY